MVLVWASSTFSGVICWNSKDYFGSMKIQSSLGTPVNVGSKHYFDWLQSIFTKRSIDIFTTLIVNEGYLATLKYDKSVVKHGGLEESGRRKQI